MRAVEACEVPRDPLLRQHGEKPPRLLRAAHLAQPREPGAQPLFVDRERMALSVDADVRTAPTLPACSSIPLFEVLGRSGNCDCRG